MSPAPTYREPVLGGELADEAPGWDLLLRCDLPPSRT
jgi:hypothetical protein